MELGGGGGGGGGGVVEFVIVSLLGVNKSISLCFM